MNTESLKKYHPFKPTITLKDRKWPDKTITVPPIWVSTDGRDGNQSLPVPMDILRKLYFFETVVSCGFKEIEIGFPSASPTEFNFGRKLIEEKRIPDNVTIQVLVQAKEDLIIRTLESLVGARRAIIHLYNSTSPAQRRIVFDHNMHQTISIAARGVEWIQKHQEIVSGTELILEYSPESFSATETNFALHICQQVMDLWKPTPDNKIILNLPATVEVSTPNRYADQIEWFIRHLENRESAIISVHTHNDRGTGIAATELALLAGAERVEGTLFGNGERTGNADLVTLALNMYTQGVDPKLDLHNLPAIAEEYQRCTRMPIHPRHPYVGKLVCTAFSGSHQDAIRKGLRDWEAGEKKVWEVPYLPFNPTDLGREYQTSIRVNAQSGKGGVAFLLEQEHINPPKELLEEFSLLVKKHTDEQQCEATSDELKTMFLGEYDYLEGNNRFPWKLKDFTITDSGIRTSCKVRFEEDCGRNNVVPHEFVGEGNGPIEALVRSFDEYVPFQVLDYHTHSLGYGAEASAISYVKIRNRNDVAWGVGIDTDITQAAVKATFSALNRAERIRRSDASKEKGL
ncbi:MAG: 2-isopropylmalate synthase [Candidatus Taylorbacteria bacterium]|nr:2-isopropylmalate synthase [Candidatus Taylorbacteria bacterium]